MAVKRRDLPTNSQAAAIVETLAAISSTGQRPDRIFEYWLELTEATLDMLPAHLHSVIHTGQLAQDTPEVSELWARIRTQYDGKAWVFEKFSEAFGLLLNSAYDAGNM